MATGSYYHSNSFRQRAEARTLALFFGFYEAEDPPCSSLSYDDGEPVIRVRRGSLCVYHGQQYQYPLTKVSLLLKADRVGFASGAIIPRNTDRMYKACAKALNDKLFRLVGEFDCANNFIVQGMLGRDFLTLPVLRADTFYPYFFNPFTSRLRGTVSFKRRLPSVFAETGRWVTAVNVNNRDRRLSSDIPAPETIYLGGDHSPSCLPLLQHTTNKNTTNKNTTNKNNNNIKNKNKSKNKNNTSDSDADSNKPSPFFYYRDNTSRHPNHHLRDTPLIISSPFENTYTTTQVGPNVGFAKLYDGKFLYWATSNQPQPGRQISKLSPIHVPLTPFYSATENHTFSLFQGMSSLPDKVQHLPFHDFVEGAWVMGSNRLVETLHEQAFPPGVLPRLKGGFCRAGEEQLIVQIPCITWRFEKAIALIRTLGSEFFGFTTNSHGAVQCDIHSLATSMNIPEDVLLAYFAQFASSFQYVRGTVAFLGGAPMNGLFEITKPVPVGPWMRGMMIDTGTGLLCVVNDNRYFRPETRDGVSWLSEYTGPGIEEVRELNLGHHIAMAC